MIGEEPAVSNIGLTPGGSPVYDRGDNVCVIGAG